MNLYDQTAGNWFHTRNENVEIKIPAMDADRCRNLNDAFLNVD
jgi:hypothetical protein